MIYVPSYDSNSCVHIENADVIRVYENTPIVNTDVAYTDYYINSGYLSSQGLANFSTSVGDTFCESSSNLTNDFYYRLDIDRILVIFFIILIVCIYLPYKLISRAFGRWLKI